MKRTPLISWTVAFFGSVVVGGLLLGMLAVLSRDADFALLKSTASLAWTIPVISGFLTAGVVVLLIGSSEEEEPSPPEGMASSTCTSCGSAIIEEWRMCPHCGALLECDVALPGIGSQGV